MFRSIRPYLADLGKPPSVSIPPALPHADPHCGFLPSLNRGVADWDVPHHLALNAVWDLPNPSTQMAVPRFLLSGWEMGGIFTAQSGMPFSATISADRAGITTGTGNGGGQRPDYNPAPGCSTNPVNPGHRGQLHQLTVLLIPGGRHVRQTLGATRNIIRKYFSL